MHNYEVIIIGGGQSGLALGALLQQRKARFVIFEKNGRLGDSWRKRYDSLVLFTARQNNGLPGLPFPGEPQTVPTKDEAADYLEQYAAHFQLPVRLNTAVQRVERTASGFLVQTEAGTARAKNVVVATGPFQIPYIPPIVERLAPDVVSLHTADYQNEHSFRDGPVLVVGAGNSGAQLAVELARHRPVIFSSGQTRLHLPLYVLGKTIFDYMQRFGLLDAPRSSWAGKQLMKRPDPIFGYREEMKALTKTGALRLTERTVRIADRTAYFAGGEQASFPNILWATGFRPDYSWLAIPDVRDPNGWPRHERGVTEVSGLYFLGLPWQHSRASALMGGVGKDALFLADRLVR
ncbi:MULTISPECIES: NAD(P)/FAD-dependent oxidoreductase [unclassified Brevibacillus]|uniref:flavin-containing monooxygenase n=1 Tax=unclassified Brevibacillus TaxID=2684853 RepID=UPI00156B166F|nr:MULTISPECIES: NAD(P)/FAD-dependent oxidoreductase [unclassified Brevibacillus]NRQ51813.1 NAD(P)-binding domain-containing protein [Brevibacillus sp. HD1.4A]UED71116.1 NAD(P)/FAD-dependent oxidoreductase [Brevibacillus sp. HD3.3A]